MLDRTRANRERLSRQTPHAPQTKALEDERLDEGLTADIQLFRDCVNLRKHRTKEIHCNPAGRIYHSQAIREKSADVFPLARHMGNLFCGDRFLFP